MSEDTGTESGAAPSTESGGDDPKITVTRSAEELTQKLVDVSAENKKFRQRASKVAEENELLKKQLDDLKASQLKEQGQYKSLYEETVAKLQQIETSAKRDKAQFAYKTVTSQFAAEAARAGCTKVDDLIKLATADGIISELEVSQEDFTVTQDSLKAALDKAQRQYSYLYAKPTPSVRDGIPSTQNQTAPTRKDLSTLKMDELIALAKHLPN